MLIGVCEIDLLNLPVVGTTVVSSWPITTVSLYSTVELFLAEQELWRPDILSTLLHQNTHRSMAISALINKKLVGFIWIYQLCYHLETSSCGSIGIHALCSNKVHGVLNKTAFYLRIDS